MARTLAGLPAGTRVKDYISLGAVAGKVPMERVHDVLAAGVRHSCALRSAGGAVPHPGDRPAPPRR